jgi:hypothetical protein
MMSVFELPDTMAALERRPFEFSPTACDEAETMLALEPEALFRRLLRDQESEPVLLAARHILHAFLESSRSDASATALDVDADLIASQVAAAREDLHATIATLASVAPEAREAVLRQRAVLGQLGGCWLDVLSQPATQPSVIVNRLFSQYFVLRGSGSPLRSAQHLRRRALEDTGIQLPEIGAASFLDAAGARPLTALHGCFYLALSRLPANFLPELVGVHYVFHTLGVDDLLLGTAPRLTEPELRAMLAQYLALAGADERARLADGIALALALEREHVVLLADLAEWTSNRSLESKVAEIVARHAPLAGSQHGAVRVGGRPLAETFAEPDLDLGAFLEEFRESRHLSRFLEAVKIGGPMFGIFDEREAATFKAWSESMQAGERPRIELAPCTAGDTHAARWRASLAADLPPDVVIASAAPADDRELFHRLVNIENFANTLPQAAERVMRTLEAAEVMFVHGARGRYTDATYFAYTPEALYERAERIYWDKLVNPYKPLTTIPDRDEVVFLQTTYALGALIDGAWLHRLANLGRAARPSDAMLWSIYADEMGHGELRKNHLTLIHTALAGMDIKLPHIREDAFRDQGELPDELYGFSLYQLSLAMFPDRFYNEILGYNLAIEMFGLGELRLHEIQKLRHHGFDTCYEDAHLTIDNISAGHTKQAADIIVTYLDEVQNTIGAAAVQAEWRRIWRGYAAYAYIVEPALLKAIAASEAEAEAEDDGDLLI